MNEIVNTEELFRLEKEIKERKNTIALNMLEIGDRLLLAKELLDHGQFTKWLEENVSISERMARNYMRAARVFPEGKRKSISVLNSTQVLLLAELPEESRERFTKKADLDKLANMSVREMKATIKAETASADIMSHFAESVEEGYKKFDIELDKLKQHPHYDRYVTKLGLTYTGKGYIRFLSEMEEKPSWFLPIIITKDNVVIDGWQRVRAARDLGWKTIKARYIYCPQEAITDSYERTLEAVFLECQAWEYTRTSLFEFYFSMYYYTIGNIEEGNRLFEEFEKEGEEKDRKYREFLEAASVLKDVWKRLGDNVSFDEALAEALPEMEKKNIPCPEHWKNRKTAKTEKLNN